MLISGFIQYFKGEIVPGVNLGVCSGPRWSEPSVHLPIQLDHETEISPRRRIEGAPNFRRVPLTLRYVSTSAGSPGADGADRFDFVAGSDDKWVCGRYAIMFRTCSMEGLTLGTAVACRQWTGTFPLREMRGSLLISQ